MIHLDNMQYLYIGKLYESGFRRYCKCILWLKMEMQDGYVDLSSLYALTGLDANA